MMQTAKVEIVDIAATVKKLYFYFIALSVNDLFASEVILQFFSAPT
jgi:hypothetical protein